MMFKSKEEFKVEDEEAAHFEGGEEDVEEEIKHNSQASAPQQPTLQPVDPDLDGTLNENEVKLDLNDLDDSSNIKFAKTPNNGHHRDPMTL